MFLLLLATIIVTGLNIGATYYNVSLLRQLHPPTPKQYSWKDGDYPPQLPLQLDTVGLSIVEGPHFTLTADDDWGTLFPTPNEGFIQIGPDKRWFIPAMYHQLHCLDAIRVAFVLNGSYAAMHTQHCLRYLRQAVLCGADMTLEETKFVENKHGVKVPAADGVGMIHRCKDWTTLRGWMEENAVANDPFETTMFHA
ncbi:hypothetical protein Clacol_000316 [Clathrus columnatus]|uniref:Oxidase ustYa n=1 Tax=Clathrus columnatus TaxID=1419009 RepID=A0AAV4ZY73_9AGAM|nr:hypothetical protein Clacol_000316 [Clathrus columnatus]